jgi:hypothetical protein
MRQDQNHILRQGEEDEVKEQPMDVGKFKTDILSFFGLELSQVSEISY